MLITKQVKLSPTSNADLAIPVVNTRNAISAYGIIHVAARAVAP